LQFFFLLRARARAHEARVMTLQRAHNTKPKYFMCSCVGSSLQWASTAYAHGSMGEEGGGRGRTSRAVYSAVFASLCCPRPGASRRGAASVATKNKKTLATPARAPPWACSCAMRRRRRCTRPRCPPVAFYGPPPSLCAQPPPPQQQRCGAAKMRRVRHPIARGVQLCLVLLHFPTARCAGGAARSEPLRKTLAAPPARQLTGGKGEERAALRTLSTARTASPLQRPARGALLQPPPPSGSFPTQNDAGGFAALPTALGCKGKRPHRAGKSAAPFCSAVAGEPCALTRQLRVFSANEHMAKHSRLSVNARGSPRCSAPTALLIRG
jgi:hypothetical protein